MIVLLILIVYIHQKITVLLSLEEQFLGDISALAEYNIVSSDCRSRVQNFFSSCSEIFDDDPPTEVYKLSLLHY